jgi:NAD(P)H-dependent flavin oxidoreductase YrpB (nitropropane dioxygenase family)
MPASWNRNRLTEKLGIDYPIIQGPLGGLSSQRLTAAVSDGRTPDGTPGAVELELKNGTRDPSSAAFVKDLYK